MSSSGSDSSDTDNAYNAHLPRTDDETSDDETTDEEEDDDDPRDQLLTEVFKTKEIKFQISDWVRKKLRTPFLGQPIGKDERKELVAKYYCGPGDYRLFSAPTVLGWFVGHK